MSTLIARDDEVLVLTEDDLLIRLADTRPVIVDSAITSAPGRPPTPDRTLMIGWNSRSAKIITLLDRLVEPRSLIDVAAARQPEHDLQEHLNNDGNPEIAQVTKADDFIVSTKRVSLLLTQLVEDRHLHAVFTDLFDPAGSEIYLKPATNYLVPYTPANFATVIEAARRQGETAIGYRIARYSENPPTYGIFLNPAKTAPLSFCEDDAVVVLAEDGHPAINLPAVRDGHHRGGTAAVPPPGSGRGPSAPSPS
ncbi:hypothetical protein ACFVOR_36840 [Streptomyces sp. NPDC057837]|uniref:hypothetical protein n=1 Tax=Streptomyces sp. NPDC057837 TaxID=3346260 RepID=UPI0036A738A4